MVGVKNIKQHWEKAMKKKLSILIEEDIYDKFYMALSLTKQEENRAAEECMKWYIAKTFEKISREYQPEKKRDSAEKGNFYGKAMKRIPVWAKRPEQYCHKIIRGFFLCEEKQGAVYVNDLEELCSREELPELFVPMFRNNYSQMKIDGVKTYGKVFEDDGKVVHIWNEVEEILREYKDDFTH